MKHWKNKYKLRILVGMFVLFIVGCPNNLVDKIEEEVEVVVTPPSVVSIYPVSESVSIPVDMDNILITFSKHIDSSSVNSSTFITTDSDGNTVSGTYSVSNDTISFNPSSNLHYSTVYTITAKSAILDINGNPMADEFFWTFTTEDAPAGIQPVIQVFEIDSGRNTTNSANIELGIYATDYNGGTSGLSFHYRATNDQDWSGWFDLTDGAGTVAKILSIVAGVTESFAFVAEAKDAAGIISNITSTQITYEVTPPSISDVNWDDESVYPYNGTSLKITFDEAVAPGSFTETDFTLWKVSDASSVAGTISINSTDTAVNVIAELWNLTLEPNTDYKIVLKPVITDMAGTPMGGGDKVWYFSTGDSTDTISPGGDVSVIGAVEIPSGAKAVGSAVMTLDLTGISDDYNTVWGMKFWGDNSGSEESFEQTAIWETFNTSRSWQVSAGDGVKFVLCKFVDSAGNESESPIQIKILLDSTKPSDPVVTINSGAAYTDAEDSKVHLVISSSDSLSGVKEMMISNSSDFSGATWETWSPTVNNWELSSGDGPKAVYVKTQDYLNQPSASGSSAIVLDTIPPSVNFNTGQLLVNSELRLLEGAAGGDIYEVTDITTPPADFTYYWEKLSGPGSMYINGIPADGNANDAQDYAEPYISANSEGTYFVQITVTDGAGNSSSASVPFTWDETAPGEIFNVSVTQSNPSYSTSNQPTWSWDDVTDADFYRTSFVSNFSSFEDIALSSYSPNTALSEGAHTLYIKAYDNAGNSSNSNSEPVFVDIGFPVISNDGAYYLENGIFEIDNSVNVTDSGSGLMNFQWSKVSGPGSVIFSADNLLTTNISTNADGSYLIDLTVEDNAGNITVANYTLNWDTIGPSAPVISAPSSTPDSTPTWTWESSGDGEGDYKYEFIDKNSTSSGWINTSSNSFTAPEQNAGHYPLTLKIKDQDEVGNWSNISTHIIDVDTTNIVAPFITAQSLTNDSTPTWSWTSGAGADPGAVYRWKLDSGVWSDNTSQTSYTPGSALSHGFHTLYVEETYNSTARESSKLINVDLVSPSAPNLTSQGNDTTNNDRKATYDTTPQWIWGGAGGGNGRYRYKLTRVNYANGTVRNDSFVVLTSEITTTSYTSTSLSDGTYKFEVQERDDAGNWSNFSYIKTTIDTTFPTLSSVVIEGTTRSDDTDDTYTRSTGVTVRIGGNISSETNSSYTRPVVINIYDYNVYTWDDYPTPWSTSNTSEETINVTLPSTNGTRSVYVKLRDEAGNTTSYINDTIILDTVAPSGTFSINNGAAYTPSSYFKMNLNFTDTYSTAADLWVSDYDQYSTGWNTYRTYSTIMTSDFQFPSYSGTKYSRVRVMDAAGNYVEKLENIVLQVPVPNYAYKGYYSTGATTVFYSPVTEDSGSATTYYYTYSSTDSTLDPNGNPADAAALTNHGGVTSTSSRYISGIPKETLLYFWMRAYNGDTGGWGPYSSTSVMGYSANVTIIYASADESVATYMKNSILKEDLPSLSTYITGVMPSWSVMLLPETLVSSTYSTWNIIYGDPVILTKSTTLYSSTGKTRNIVAGGHGVVGMGYLGGLRFFETVSNNWTAWGYPDITSTVSLQKPNEISYGNAYTISNEKYFMYTWGYGTTIWDSPLSSTYITSSDEGNVQTGYSPGLSERALTRPGRDNPTNGYLYGRSQDYDDKFPVVRQGRFLFYGYDGNWTRAVTGRTYFVNLIARMDNY